MWCHLPVTLVPTQETGRLGEDTAAKYLESRRYRIRERNVRFGRYEIDIVAFDHSEQMIVFVEVKTRTTVSPQYPIHTAVDREKRRSLKEARDRWITKHQYEGPGRMDIVCVSGNRVTEHVVNVGSDFF